MSVPIHLAQFEGPLALLLFLIRKQEMDIFNINITEITAQYFDHVKRMKQLDLETAGDFVAMAATLIQIKSQMLLPQHNEESEEEVVDPRKELVHKLLEYERFQKAARDLYDRPLLNREVWVRGLREKLPEDETAEDEILLDEGGLFQMISMYRRVARRKKKVHTVSTKRKSIAARILEIKDLLTPGERVILETLVSENMIEEDLGPERLITFLSALELGKMGLVSVYQAETYGDIYLTAQQRIEGHMLNDVQEYDDDSNKLADALFDQPLPLAVAAQQREAEAVEEAEESATDEDINLAEQELNLAAEQ